MKITGDMPVVCTLLKNAGCDRNSFLVKRLVLCGWGGIRVQLAQERS